MISSVSRRIVGSLGGKFNPVQKTFSDFSWIRIGCHFLLLFLVLCLFVVYLTLGLVHRDVTTKHQEPRDAGFKISDDGDLYICDCDVVSYPISSLIGNIAIDISDTDQFQPCRASQLDCFADFFDCVHGTNDHPDSCDLEIGSTCSDYGVCDDDDRECMKKCDETLEECFESAGAALGIYQSYGQDYPADGSVGDSIDAEEFRSIPACELKCFNELLFAYDFCSSSYVESDAAQCEDVMQSLLNARPQLADFYRRVGNMTDDPGFRFGDFSNFCGGNVDLCLFTGYGQYGQCLRHECESPSYCTFIEHAVLTTEILTKLDTMLGGLLVSVPQYYGSKDKTIGSIERFLDQNVDFWAEYVIQQSEEELDAIDLLCSEAVGLCAGVKEIYSPLHQIDVKSLRNLLRDNLLNQLTEKRDDTYDTYLDLCGEVTCIVFQEKGVWSVFLKAIGDAMGNMALLFLGLSMCYRYIMNATKSSDVETPADSKGVEKDDIKHPS